MLKPNLRSVYFMVAVSLLFINTDSHAMKNSEHMIFIFKNALLSYSSKNDAGLAAALKLQLWSSRSNLNQLSQQITFNYSLPSSISTNNYDDGIGRSGTSIKKKKVKKNFVWVIYILKN